MFFRQTCLVNQEDYSDELVLKVDFRESSLKCTSYQWESNEFLKSSASSKTDQISSQAIEFWHLWRCSFSYLLFWIRLGFRNCSKTTRSSSFYCSILIENHGCYNERQIRTSFNSFYILIDNETTAKQIFSSDGTRAVDCSMRVIWRAFHAESLS